LGGSLEEQLGDTMRTRGATIATAESCSGGLIAHRITNVPGSSSYFLGGVISYSNEAKKSLLAVAEPDLAEHGAVSEVVARAMVQGIQEHFGADYALACTGIAGPGGGTDDKPVGLVYIGVAGPGDIRVERCTFDGDRESIKEQTAECALALLLEMAS